MEKKTKLIKTCETCGLNATFHCFDCLEYFCDSCFKFNHDKQVKSQHKKENIDLYVPIELKCPYHPKNPNNLFCIKDKGN